MKKFVVIVSVAVLMAFAAPVLAATNPFMDVPMNHWAYDAIGQLAANGILSGYPDGLYRGKQPTTRYEMASALARALAYVDMTKASKQDVEMLKKLVAEFKDELDALGVRVDGIDKRLSVIENRLSGWKIKGQLRLDVTNKDNTAPVPDSGIALGRARLWLERWFGEDDSMYFQARFNMTAGAVTMDRFFATIPFYWDSKLTVGRFLWDMEEEYYLGGTTSVFGFMSGGLDSVLTDRSLDAIGWQKEFGVGKVSFYMAHPELNSFMGSFASAGLRGIFPGLPVDPAGMAAWEFFGMGQFQFNEKFGFDLGFQAFVGDNAEYRDLIGVTTFDGAKMDSLWTLFAGLRFNFNDNIALKAIYYHQVKNFELWDNVGGVWYDQILGVDIFDDANAFKAILDVKQDAIKFTSLWLEYSKYEQGFMIPTGGVAGLFHEGLINLNYRNTVPVDLDIWRIAGEQKWNDKWATYFYVAGYNFNNLVPLPGPIWRDAKATQWGLGVRYTYNPSVSFGLGYSDINWNTDAETAGFVDDHIVRFRTQVTF